MIAEGSLLQAKTELREMQTRMRDALHIPQAAEKLAGHAANLAAQFDIKPGTIIAGYWPIKSELNPLPLMKKLAAMGAATALPQTPALNTALVFRIWNEGDALTQGLFGTHEPPATAAPCTPDIILTPLLAFDARGYRLGYGGGFYDRTLATWPQSRAIGIGYDEQETQNLPIDTNDIALYAMLTPQKGLRRF